MRLSLCLLLLSLTGAPDLVAASAARAGVARIDITPDGPIWMAGYSARKHPSEGVFMPLYAKALALEDGRGGRVVIVTTDVLGLPRSITDVVAARAMKEYGLERSGVLFNSSHTHTGPVVLGNLSVISPESPEDGKVVAAYAVALQEKLFSVIGAALADLAPATLSFDYGEAAFAINRRQATPKGVVIGLNPNGPVDHRVPVLRVTAPNGKVRAILFGYACHNTTLTAEFYRLSGDYAGVAQAEIERQVPGAIALFMQLCGGDQNPNPRSKLELAKQHGAELSSAVMRVVRTPMQPVSGRLRASFLTADLPFAPHTREQYQQDLASSNKYIVSRAQQMLKLYDQGHAPRSLQYPVQALRFDKGFTLVALGGEVVIDYDLWLRQRYPDERLMVAGYSNDVAAYIPSARVLNEGGYEAVDSMIYYGQPGPFSPEMESRLHDAIQTAMRRAGRK
jgi:hypothetical protein